MGIDHPRRSRGGGRNSDAPFPQPRPAWQGQHHRLGRHRDYSDWPDISGKKTFDSARAEERFLTVLLHPCPDSRHLQQADENPDCEVEVLGRGVAGRLRQADAALTEVNVNRALLLHHFGRDGTMEKRDQEPQQQTRDLDYHIV